MTQPLSYKDLLHTPTQLSEKDLGRKGMSLASLVSQSIPVPPFFILPPELFKSIIVDIFKDKSVASLSEFRKRIASDSLSAETVAQIETEYAKLSGFGKTWVAVRSSIVAPEHPQVSFSGLLSSKLNVRGTKEIDEGIKEIFMSLFSDRSYDYLKRNSISYGDVSTAIVVQKMIQAEVSGIMYTYDPITTNASHVSIEAVFGLGDVLADGNINPDIYTVSKETLDIVEKKIVPQEWMKVRKMGDTQSLEHLQKITISKMWQYSQKLDDALIRELTKLAETVEKALGGPQVIEWAMERGNLYVLQAKPIAAAVNTELKHLHETKRKISSAQDLDTFSTLSDTVPVSIHTPPPDEKPVILPQETLLFTGTPACPGTVYGEVLLLPSAASLTEESLATLKTTITKKHILVTDEFTATLEPLFFLAGAVVTNFGGANSDVAIVAREAQIPAIVGTRIATTYLQTSTLLKVDGAAGAIYRVDFLPETSQAQATPATVEQKTKKKKLKKVKKKKALIVDTTPVEVKIEPKLLQKQEELPVKIYLPETIQSPYLYQTNITNSPLPSIIHSIVLPVQNAHKDTILHIKKLKKSQAGHIYLLLPDSPSLEEMLQTKRDLAAMGIRRSKKVSVIARVQSMYGILNTRVFNDIGVDGLVFDIPAIASAYKPGSTSIDSELFGLIEKAIDTIKRQKYSLIGLLLPKEYQTIPLRKELHQAMKLGVSALMFPDNNTTFIYGDSIALAQSIVSLQLGK